MEEERNHLLSFYFSLCCCRFLAGIFFSSGLLLLPICSTEHCLHFQRQRACSEGLRKKARVLLCLPSTTCVCVCVCVGGCVGVGGCTCVGV